MYSSMELKKVIKDIYIYTYSEFEVASYNLLSYRLVEH